MTASQPFRNDNTTGLDLAAANRAFELAAVAHLSDSIYQDGDVIDFDRWAQDDPEDYQALQERVLKRLGAA